MNGSADGGTDAPLPQSEVTAGELVTRVLDLVGSAGSIADFGFENARQWLRLPIQQETRGVWRYLATLTPDWNYLIQYDEALATGPAFVVDFFSDSDPSPAMTGLSEVDVEQLAAGLQASGYQRRTRYGEHGQVVDHQFSRDQLTVTVITVSDPERVGREWVQSIMVR